MGFPRSVVKLYSRSHTLGPFTGTPGWRQDNQKPGVFNTEVQWRTGSSYQETIRCYPGGTSVLFCHVTDVSKSVGPVGRLVR